MRGRGARRLQEEDEGQEGEGAEAKVEAERRGAREEGGGDQRAGSRSTAREGARQTNG